MSKCRLEISKLIETSQCGKIPSNFGLQIAYSGYRINYPEISIINRDDHYILGYSLDDINGVWMQLFS